MGRIRRSLMEPKRNPIDEYVMDAHAAGISREQLTRFCRAGYVSIKPFLSFHATARQLDNRIGVDEILLDGTRGSAKSHAIIAQVGLDDSQKYPGLKTLFLRKTQKAASESFDDLVGRVLKNVKHVHNTEKVRFPNKSRITIGGFDDDRDIEKYIGIEYDCIVIEEATQIKGDNHQRLKGSLRSSRPGWVPRMYLSTNPGGIGHVYIKERFISNPQKNTRRFFSTYKDNPFINPEYKTYLETLTGDLAKAWRDGDWDIFAGQFFSRFRNHIHVINPLSFIPPTWERFAGIDYGTANPFCCLFGVVDYDSNVYIYRELYRDGLTAKDQAQWISEARKEERISRYLADPSMWAKTQAGAAHMMKSIANIYHENGVPIMKANNDRIHGANVVRQYLDWEGEENDVKKKPKLFICNTCSNLIRTLPSLIHDEKKPEDVDTDGEDHAYDALRYMLVHTFESHPPRGMREYSDFGYDDHGFLKKVFKKSPVLSRPRSARFV